MRDYHMIPKICPYYFGRTFQSSPNFGGFETSKEGEGSLLLDLLFSLSLFFSFLTRSILTLP